MARPRNSADIAGDIRGALKRAMLIMEEGAKGRKPLSDIWLKLFENDPATAMRLAISTMPKDMNVLTTTLDPEQWLELMSDASKSEGTEPKDSVSGQLH